jgi:hypothetical protein
MTITDARRIYRFGLGRVPAAQAVAVVLASSAAARLAADLARFHQERAMK